MEYILHLLRWEICVLVNLYHITHRRSLMIDNTIQTQVTTNAQSTDCTIDMNSHIFAMMTKNVYTNVVAAVIREWSTNAIDACIAAGSEHRFDVHIPTASDPSFSVRDYGTGLSPDDIVGLFSVLGASTKRDSNAFNGVFGIGRMAGLAYTDMFSVDSFFDGTRYSYAVSISTGTPNIIQIGSVPTDEQNGLMLSVYVLDEDIGRFTSEARDIYQYFDSRPHTNIPFEYTSVDGAFRGDDWYIENSNLKYHIDIVMGNVKYSFAERDIRENVSVQNTIPGLILEVPNGAVSYTPGREALNLDKTTIAYLNARLDTVLEKYKSGLLSYIDSFPTDLEKLTARQDYYVSVGWNIRRHIPTLIPSYTSGYINDNYYLNIHNIFNLSQMPHGRIRSKRVDILVSFCKTDLFVIGDIRVNIDISARSYIDSLSSSVRFNTFIMKPLTWNKSPEAIAAHVAHCKQVLSDIGITNYILASDYETKVATRSGITQKVSTVHFIIDNENPIEILSRNGIDIPASEPGPIYYVENRGFNPHSMTRHDLSLHIRAALIYDRIHETDTSIVGIPKSAMVNIVDDDRFIPLAGAFDDRFREMQPVDYSHHLEIDSFKYSSLDTEEEIVPEVRDFLEKHIAYTREHQLDGSPASTDGIVERFGCSYLSPGSELTYDEFTEKYPLFIFIAKNYNSYRRDSHLPAIIDYVNYRYNLLQETTDEFITDTDITDSDTDAIAS